MKIRVLRPSDHRSNFNSGEPALDRFFRFYAGQNQFRHYLGVTYVAIEKSLILGYVTVSPRQIDIDNLNQRVRNKLPRYPIQALGLVRLAVDKQSQSKGIGTQFCALC